MAAIRITTASPRTFRRVASPPAPPFGAPRCSRSHPSSRSRNPCGTRYTAYASLSPPFVPKANRQDRPLSGGSRRTDGHLPPDGESAGGQHALPEPHPPADVVLPGANDPPSNSVAATERMAAAITATTSPLQEGEEGPGRPLGSASLAGTF